MGAINFLFGVEVPALKVVVVPTRDVLHRCVWKIGTSHHRGCQASFRL